MKSGSRQFRAMLLFGIIANLAIFSLNHIVGIAVNGGDYTPFSVDHRISAAVYDETQTYAEGPARFFRTGQAPAELDVFELRYISNSTPVLPSVLFGLFAKAAGSLELAWMIAHAILPTLIWAFLFWNAYRIVDSALLAAMLTWITCFIAFAPRNFLLLGKERFLQPLELARTPEPALSFLVLLAAIWLLSRAMAWPSLSRILTAGLVSGTLFYLYYFYWIAFFSGAVSLLIVMALARRRDHTKTVAAIVLLGSLSGIPFIVRSLDGMRSGHQMNLMLRMGYFTRWPNTTGLFLALLLGGALWLYCTYRIRVRADDGALFGGALLAVATGAAIGLNFHLLTGFDAQHGHFYNRALQPLLTYFLLLMLFSVVRLPERVRRYMIATAPAVIALLLAVAALRQIEVGRNTAPYHRKTSPDMDVLLWIRSHLPSGIVIGSNDLNLLALIPGITGTWTFVPVGDRSMASNEEILRRYFIVGRLQGSDWKDLEAALKSDPGYQTNMGYTLVMQQRILPETMVTARAVWDSLDLRRDLKDRKLDYLISSRADGGAPPVTPNSSNTVYQNSAWSVSRVR